MHADLSMLQGLEVGSARLGVVGTVSRLLVPALVAEIKRVAPGVSLRLTEGASERLAAEVAERELACAVVTEPVSDPRLIVEHLRDEALVALLPQHAAVKTKEPISLRALAEYPLILPPVGNPLREEVDVAAATERVALNVAVEVEGIRLILDLVAAGAGFSIVPETAIPPESGLRSLPIAQMPPRRLAMVRTRNVQLTLADQAVHDLAVRLAKDPDVVTVGD
jgi:DNA-binding transcriptional LysR family regulator